VYQCSAQRSQKRLHKYINLATSSRKQHLVPKTVPYLSVPAAMRTSFPATTFNNGCQLLQKGSKRRKRQIPESNSRLSYFRNEVVRKSKKNAVLLADYGKESCSLYFPFTSV
jgi:hypothetical protein